METQIQGISVEIIKKNIKNMYLYVRPPDGKVQVSVPLEMSEESVLMFVSSKIEWIRKQQAKFEKQPRQTKRQYVSGESFYVLGKQYYLQVNYGDDGDSLVLSGDRAILTVKRESTLKHRERFVREWYRQILKKQIEELLPKWEEKTKLRCDSWQIKYMKTRWGTCNPATKKLWFNLQLAKKNIKCTEYVILHELLHLKIQNHGVDFIENMNFFMNDWRSVRTKLNEQILDCLEID